MSSPTRETRASLACALLLLVGVAGRVYGYLTSDSLWLDELFITNNLRELSFAELLGPLKYGQNAPVGWLLLQKTAISLFGHGELVLRLPSLLASVLALVLTAVVARRVVGTTYATYAVAIVGLSPFVAWQGLQAKQYSTDILTAVALLALAIPAIDRSGRRLVPLGIAGCAGIFLSMPSVFVLAATGLVLLVVSRRRALQAWGAAWVAAFALNYFAFLRPRSQEAWLYDYWSPGLFPWPIDRWDDARWLPRVLSDAMENPVGFIGIGFVAILPVLVGLARVRHSTAAGRTVAVVALPVLLTLAAAIANVYPFTIRMLLFLVPSFAILFALGIRTLAAVAPCAKFCTHAFALAVLAVPAALFCCWLPSGGLPIAADTSALFRTLGEQRAANEVAVIEDLAGHAKRYYGDGLAQPLVDVAPAWNDPARVATLRSTLEELTDARAWVVLSRVEHDDNRHRRTAGIYRRFVEHETRWLPLDAFRTELPPGWRIEREHLFYGCCLWLLSRE